MEDPKDPICRPKYDYVFVEVEDTDKDFTEDSIREWIQRDHKQREMIRQIDIKREMELRHIRVRLKMEADEKDRLKKARDEKKKVIQELGQKHYLRQIQMNLEEIPEVVTL